MYQEMSTSSKENTRGKITLEQSLEWDDKVNFYNRNENFRQYLN